MLTLEEARKFFKKDAFASKFAGAYIEDVSYEFSRCSMNIEKKHLNAAGLVHGGVIFTLGDFAFAVAANSSYGLTVSLSNQITFHRSSRGSKLYAEASILNRGKTTCFYYIKVYDDLGANIATMTINGYIKKDPLVI